MEINTEGLNEVVLQEMETDNLKVEILQFEELQGSKHPASAQELYFSKEVGMRMKRVKFTLDDAAIKIEPGALHYMRGDLEIDSGTQGKGLRGFGRALWRSVTSGETVFKTTIKGSGEVYLDPTFGHFIIEEMDDTKFVADRGIFAACDAKIEVGSERIAKVSSMLFGGEGWFQTTVEGSGLVVFEIPVPMSEVVTAELDDEKLSVDGSFAMLRTGGLDFEIGKSSKSWFKSILTSGEGLLQTFEGSGKVWLAPTNSYYEEIEEERRERQAAQVAMRQSMAALASSVKNNERTVADVDEDQEEEEEEEEED